MNDFALARFETDSITVRPPTETCVISLQSDISKNPDSCGLNCVKLP